MAPATVLPVVRDDPGTYGVTADPRPEAPPEDRSPCPACGEMIKTTAAKCRYCGEIFDETLRRAEKKRATGEDADLSAGDWVLAVLCPNIACIMSLVWMAFVAALIAAEKLLPWRRVATYGTAAILLLLGVLLLVAPDAIPALTTPGMNPMPEMQQMGS